MQAAAFPYGKQFNGREWQRTLTVSRATPLSQPVEGRRLRHPGRPRTPGIGEYVQFRPLGYDEADGRELHKLARKENWY